MRTADNSTARRTTLCASALASLVLLAVVLTGCGQIREVMLSTRSPDGSHTAYAVRVNSGGATTGFEYEVVVVPSETTFDVDSHRGWVWRSYRMPPTDLAWADADSINVEVAEDSNYQDMIQARRVGAINASTTVLPDEGESSGAQP